MPGHTESKYFVASLFIGLGILYAALFLLSSLYAVGERRAGTETRRQREESARFARTYNDNQGSGAKTVEPAGRAGAVCPGVFWWRQQDMTPAFVRQAGLSGKWWLFGSLFAVVILIGGAQMTTRRVATVLWIISVTLALGRLVLFTKCWTLLLLEYLTIAVSLISVACLTRQRQVRIRENIYPIF